MVTAKEVQELRRRSEAGMTECKRALEEAGGDVERAMALLRERGVREAERRSERPVREGRVGSYVHHDGRLGALVEVGCETDFVARTDTFQTLVRQLAEHVAAAAPLGVDVGDVPSAQVAEQHARFLTEARASGKPASVVERMVAGRLDAFVRGAALLRQPWVREPKTTIAELVQDTASRVGERVQVRRFTRFRLGDA